MSNNAQQRDNDVLHGAHDVAYASHKRHRPVLTLDTFIEY